MTHPEWLLHRVPSHLHQTEVSSRGRGAMASVSQAGGGACERGLSPNGSCRLWNRHLRGRGFVKPVDFPWFLSCPACSFHLWEEAAPARLVTGKAQQAVGLQTNTRRKGLGTESHHSCQVTGRPAKQLPTVNVASPHRGTRRVWGACAVFHEFWTAGRVRHVPSHGHSPAA